MTPTTLNKKLRNKEIKIWTSTDYYLSKEVLGFNRYLTPLPEKDETVIEDYEWKQYPNLLVCLDNGHASTTPGKRSSYLCSGVLPKLELYEYEFNRKVTAKLKEKLEKSGVTVFMVCPEVNRDIALTTRYKRANDFAEEHSELKPLLISVHANAYGNGDAWNSARGWSAYTTKGQNNSDKLAECLYDSAEEIFIPKGMKIKKNFDDGDRDYEENFTIIWGANMPAVLTENFFYTNIEDCKYIMSDEGIEDIAEMHYRAILKFADTHYKM